MNTKKRIIRKAQGPGSISWIEIHDSIGNEIFIYTNGDVKISRASGKTQIIPNVLEDAFR